MTTESEFDQEFEILFGGHSHIDLIKLYVLDNTFDAMDVWQCAIDTAKMFADDPKTWIEPIVKAA